MYVDLELPEGVHNYMFIVDGKWTHDPTNTLVSFGTLSSREKCNVIATIVFIMAGGFSFESRNARV